jgi:DNA-binding transcriptional MocR family regulator
VAVDLVRRALRVPRLTPAEKIVLVEYAERANSEGIAWGSARKMAEDIGIRTRTVERARAQLVRRGLLRVEQAGGGRTVSTRYYVLTTPTNTDISSVFHGKPKSLQGRGNTDVQTPITRRSNPQKLPRVRGPAVQGPVSHANGKEKTASDPAAVQLWLAENPERAKGIREEAARQMGALGALNRLALVPERTESITEKLVLDLASKQMAG